MIAAGRELDALVAEKVMGQEVRQFWVSLDPECGGWNICTDCLYGEPDYTELDIPRESWPPAHTSHAEMQPCYRINHLWQVVPDLSEDMAAAWGVVERMHDLGWWLDANAYFSDDAGCNAGFTPKNITGWNGRPDHAANAPTLPHAICLAALKTLGVDVDVQDLQSVPA